MSVCEPEFSTKLCMAAGHKWLFLLANFEDSLAHKSF